MAFRLSDENKVEIIEMGNAGLTVSEIAEEMGCSNPTVAKVLREYNIPIGKPGRKTLLEMMDPESIDYLHQAYTETEESVASIAEKIDVTYGQLYKLLDQLDIPRRRFKEENIRGNDERMEQAIVMYADGAPLWMIKEETGIHQPTLHAEIHRRGIPLRRPRSGSGDWKKR